MCILNLAGYTQDNIIATHACGRVSCHLHVLASGHLLVFNYMIYDIRD